MADRIQKYWLWDQAPTAISKEQALECIIIADSIAGDEMIFHPREPNVLYWLPRYLEQAFQVQGGFLAACDWFAESGVITDPFTSWQFKPTNRDG